jgi:hypothetical protein
VDVLKILVNAKGQIVDATAVGSEVTEQLF